MRKKMKSFVKLSGERNNFFKNVLSGLKKRELFEELCQELWEEKIL
jgi:hypothetical protein